MREIRLTIITATLAAALLQFQMQMQGPPAKVKLACTGSHRAILA
ncbi:MAG: hypothetical protein JWN66_885 [Sphingomonas bacterium]|jgi:hypothetical protein|nr:hypothetical protein [Sphingomonas bacterium]MDB5703769.1 hypothetical protein [Sphingomonas bacterium]